MPLGSSAFSRSTLTRSIRASLVAPVCAAAFAAFLLSPAQADQYHTVTPGETLASVAARYNMQPEVLRKANNLSSFGDGTALPAMLLRVPDATEAPATRPANNAPTSSGSGAGSGSLRATAAYRVQPGDTLESIAQRYNAAGYRVSVEDIRLRNTLAGQPAAGTTLYVPLGSATYSSQGDAANSARSTSTGGTSYSPASQPVGGGAFLSEELPLPMAQVYRPQGQPVYRAPEAPRAAESAQRGPTALASRGMPDPSLNVPGGRLDGARVLAPSEEAPNTAPNGMPSVSRSPQNSRSTTRGNSANLPILGRVAQVSHGGAKIRRLPSSGAATLYRCATGTQVAVIKAQGAWVAILMSDRSTGWMPAQYLQYTGARVDVTAAIAAANAAANDDSGNSGGSWSRSGNFSLPGTWNSDNPVVAQALTWIGTPYVYGGTSRRGIDCSSLVQHAFAACGYKLPRTAAQQARVGMPVDPANLRAGDRLYFSKSGTHIDHTGLYMGNGRFVQASGRGRAVIVSNLADARNWNIFVCARR